MAKRKRRNTKQFKLKHPREVGKFYRISDNNGGHPVLIYYADPEKDIYYVQRFSTKKRRGRIKLKNNIDPNSNKDQWLIIKPVVVHYDDLFYHIK